MKNETCYSCGSIATTRDHIPPKSFFEKPLPDNLITVSACKNCNTGFSRDEEWFRNQILAMSFSDRGRRLWTTRVRKALSRKPAMKFEMRSNIIKRSDGLSEIKFSQQRTNPIIQKIIQGLFYHHFKQMMSKNLQWDIYFNPKDNLLEKYSRFAKFFSIQEDAFRYAFVTADENSNYSLWWLLFHNNALFIVGVTEL